MNFRSGALRALAIGLFSALLVSCGGEELKPFNPARILVFGDQASVIVAGSSASDGRKYTINYEDDTGQINCGANPIWIQVLASAYAISFPECPLPADTSTPLGLIRAVAGATAGGDTDIDLTAQVTRQLDLPEADGGAINSTDLVTVYAGVNDVVAAFERFKAGVSYDEVIAQVEAAGETLAGQINRIADAGGKVIVSTVPDVGVTPYARAQTADDAARLTYLTGRLNARLLVTIDNNGRKIGLIELNPYLIAVVGNPLGYGYLDVENAACIPLDPLLCTTKTLVPDGASYTWLWASSLQFSPQGHVQLGNLAATRAKNQPF